MKAALIVFTALADLAGAAFACGVAAMLWQAEERSRRRTCIAASLLAAVSAAAALVFTLMLPQAVFTPGFSDADPVFSDFLAVTAAQGLLSGVTVLAAPFLILRIRRRTQALFTLLTAYMIEQAGFGIVSTLLRLTADSPKKLLAEAVYGFCAFGLLAALFFWGASRTAALPLKGAADRIPRWIYPLMMLFAFTVYAKDSLFDGGLEAETAGRIFDALWILATLGVAICIGYFMYQFFSMAAQQNRVMRQLAAQQAQYERAMAGDEALRAFRHDYKNHMMVVTALLNSGKAEEAAQYLERIKVAAGTPGRQFSTGNFIADAILNDKYMLAEEFSVHISFSGRIPAKGIENSDLCTVLANLIDNAVEAAKQTPGPRFVEIEAAVRNGFLALSVANSIAAPVEIKGNRIRTTKGDTRMHGIGLRNVERTAKDYHGQMMLSCTDTRFQADVMMKLNVQDTEE